MDPMSGRGEPAMSPRAHFGRRLRYWRQARRMTQDALGRRLGYDDSLISRVESGARRPPLDLAARGDEVLRTDGELSELWPLVDADRGRSAPSPDMSGPGVVAPDTGAAGGAGRSMPRIDLIEPVLPYGGAPAAGFDARATESMRALLAEYRRASDDLHARRLLWPVEWHLRALVAVVTDGHPPPAGLLTVAAQWAELAGWLCFDIGARDRALAWYDRGHQWALAGGDADLGGRLLARKSTAAWETRDTVAAAGYARAAREIPGIGPGTHAWAALAQARADASAGHRGACEQHLNTAEQLVEEAVDADPGWWWLHGPAGRLVPRLARATCYHELAAHDAPRLAARAVEGFEGALTAIGASGRRDRALFLARCAAAQLRAGEPERAAEAADRALSAGESTRSRRALGVLDEVRAWLRADWPYVYDRTGLADRLAMLHAAERADTT